MSTGSDPGLPEPEPGQRVGPFRLEAVLGEGGMGLVYRAVREPTGETVAVKVLKRALCGDSIYRQRFAREARVASKVQHRHLVPVLEAGEEEGVNYLAMAFVEGATLDDRIKAERQLPLSDCVRIISEVASGLDALHSEGLVHRDVKPANVLLDRQGTAALTDFGLARGDAYTVLTKPGQVMGTLDYLAPEIISRGSAGPASDIYALGCMAYACVTGSAPFADRSLFEVAVAHVEEEPADPALARPDVPSGLAWGILQALGKDPARRPTTAGAYARMLGVGLSSAR